MMIAAMAVFAVILAIAALCCDIGLRRLVDSELQNAADASALAAGQYMMNCLADDVDPDEAAAAAVAASNINRTTLGELKTTAGDTTLGIWDPDARSFTATGRADLANAVRVTVKRTAERGNGIPTLIAKAMGYESMTSTRTAIARIEVPPDYPMVGLDGFSSSGILVMNNGSWASGQANLASNGNVKLNILGLVGITSIQGHVSAGGDVACPLIGILTKIEKGIRHPERPFELPPVSLAAVETRNDNAQLGALLTPQNDLNVVLAADIPAGTYCVENLRVIAGAVLKTHGPTTIYVRNSATILGTLLALNGEPSNLKIRVAGTGGVVIAANLALTTDLYAPASDVTIAAGVAFRGRCMAKRVSVLGTSFFQLKPDLPPPELGRPCVTLVK